MSLWSKLKRKKEKQNVQTDTVSALIESLTEREFAVLQNLLDGLTIKQTAQKLGIKYSTVNTHMTSIYKKLKVNTRSELIIKYRNQKK